MEGFPDIPKVRGKAAPGQFFWIVRQVAPLIAGVEIPVEVTVGGSTIFVLNVDRFEKV